jgi:hypothetical protein
MRKQSKVLLIAFVLVASLAAAPALLAHDSRNHGMMGRDGMMDNRGMMGRMGSMMRMMEHCSQMMGEDSRQPNNQWRKGPSAPSEKR